MNLTKENIAFIDAYLKKSDIEFIDIRMEMLDHVANAIEAKMQQENLNFYDAFKDYMVVHKKGLIQSFESQKKELKYKSIVILLRNFTKPYAVALVVIVSLLVFKWEDFTATEFPNNKIVFGTNIFTAVIFCMLKYFNRKNKFSVIEFLAMPLAIVNPIIYFLFDYSLQKPRFYNYVPLLVDSITIFLISLNLIFLVTLFQKNKEIRRKYSLITT